MSARHEVDVYALSDLDEMISVEETKKHVGVERHYLLLGIVEAAKKRSRQQARQEALSILERYAQMHVAEFPALAQELIRSSAIGEPGDEDYMPPEETLPNVPTFKIFADYLSELGRYREAISVVREAVKYPFPEHMLDGLRRSLALIHKRIGSEKRKS
jgi:hypothetical protein